MMGFRLGSFSTSVLLSRMKYKAILTESAKTQHRMQLVSSSNYFKSFSYTSSLNNRRFLNNTMPILSTSFLTSNNFGVRNFSTEFASEKLEALSKFLEGSPVDWLQNLLLWEHATTGLSWSATIILNSLVIRACFNTPGLIYQMHIGARIRNVQSEMEGISWKLKKNIDCEARINQWSERMTSRKYAISFKQELQKLYVRDNCHPSKLFVLALIYLGTFICQTIAIRNLCYMLPVPDILAKITRTELSVGGFGWVKDLTLTDEYFILPILLATFSFSTLEMKNLMKPRETSIKFLRFIQKASIVVFPIISLVVSANVPVAVVLSWITNSVMIFLESLLFTTPKVRNFLGIPKSADDYDRPIAVLLERIKAKYRLSSEIKHIS